MESDFLSWGQALAWDQIRDIASASNGAFEIVEESPPTGEDASLVLQVSVDTRGYEYVSGGFKFRQREPIIIEVSSRFPIDHPTAKFAHKRFLGFPHVQWGRSLCLYLSPDVEWNSKDGMFGYVQRLHQWLRDAALNELDPDGAPLHPPVAYTKSHIGFVFEQDAPEIPSDKYIWLGAAHIKARNKVCYDVTGWTALSEKLPDNTKLAACILLSKALPMEYPETVFGLISELQKQDIPFHFLFDILKFYAAFQIEDNPLYIAIGAPMRRRSAGEVIRHHMAVWRIEPESALALKTILVENGENADAAIDKFITWAASAKTEWCTVYDNREEVTYRRDLNTNAGWVYGKSIAIFGCGALGSHIAEYVVRAGASKVSLIDNSTVKPGVLVRQQFDTGDVGFTKESALSVRLSKISPKADITYIRRDLRKGAPDELDINEFDLVVDATASRHVNTALHIQFDQRANLPAILGCSIDGNATRGVATLRMSNSQSGLCDISRQLKLAAFSRHGLKRYAKAFWPSENETPLFQPEPGCSDPTFVGSAADVAFFASTFFDFALQILQNTKDDKTFALYASKPERGKLGGGLSSRIVELPNLHIDKDALQGYRVVVSDDIHKSVQAEITHNGRTGSKKNETGGLLLGEIDDGIATIYLDTATGAPPDSIKSPERFECGIEGTADLCEYHKGKTEGSTHFVGVWHTHPVQLPEPSLVDLGAMAKILHLQKNTPRQVVMLIVGFAKSDPEWRFHLFRRNQFKVIKVPQ